MIVLAITSKVLSSAPSFNASLASRAVYGTLLGPVTKLRSGDARQARSDMPLTADEIHSRPLVVR
jgi:hypothetical protein